MQAVQLLDKQRQKKEWQASFDQDPIDLRGLPKPIVEKARAIFYKLAQGTAYYQLGGCRLIHNRGTIRIPVTHRYRMLCDEIDGRIVPRAVMPHESYNNIANNTKR